MKDKEEAVGLKAAAMPKLMAKPKAGSSKTARKGVLVIVESPAKAKTIEKYLGAEYTVLASMGHLIDLPKSRVRSVPDK